MSERIHPLERALLAESLAQGARNADAVAEAAVWSYINGGRTDD